MIEILSVLEDKDNYIRYIDIVKKYNTDNDIKRIIDNIDIYYIDTSLPSIDWVSFKTFFFVKNPMIKDTKKILFDSMFDTLAKPTGIAIKSTLVNTFLERYHAQRIAVLAMDVDSGKTGVTLETVSDELQAYFSSSGRLGTGLDGACYDDLETLFKHSISGTGLKWRLEALNDSLGEVHKGNFILFAGRPDAGKSTLLCSEGTFMTQQLSDSRCLYFSNEESSLALKPRIISSLLGVDRKTLESDPKLHWENYTRLLGGNSDKLLLVEKADLSVLDIEKWVQKDKVGLILVDQLRKVKGFNDIKGIARTETLFNWARELCKEYAPLITVTQLDGEAENIAYPSMARVYESKTAIQGEMDAIVTIGRVDGSVPANARYLGVVKNHMPRPNDPKLRNGKHEVLLLADIGRFV
jgi:energy-coupling factor transporter ATP-binding protein EcfA2